MDYVKAIEDQNFKLRQQLEAAYDRLNFINKWNMNKLSYVYKAILYQNPNEWDAYYCIITHDQLKMYSRNCEDCKDYSSLLELLKNINWDVAYNNPIDFDETKWAVSFVVDGLHPSKKVSARCLSYSFWEDDNTIKREVIRHEGWTRGWAISR